MWASCQPVVTSQYPTEPPFPQLWFYVKLNVDRAKKTPWELVSWIVSGGLPKSLLLPVQCPRINSFEFQINFPLQQFSFCLHRAQFYLEKATVSFSQPWALPRVGWKGTRKENRLISVSASSGYWVAGSFVSEESHSLMAQGFHCP